MKIKNIELLSTTDYGSYVLPTMYMYYAEAAAVCFEENNYTGSVTLKIEGERTAQFHFTWEQVSQQVKDMHNDLIYETEYGAYCIAFLIIHHLTDYKIIRRSKRKTGFDYWLGDKNAAYPFEDIARLEVSGILKGSATEIKRRIKEKQEQVEQSDDTLLPAYIVVTEFSKPISKLILKNE
jgi:hypothetical protein